MTPAGKRQSRRPLARKRRIRNTTRIAGPPSVAAVLARTRTFAIAGVEAVPVDVEIDINRGLPMFSIVGLPDAAVRESRERVRAALVNSGFEFPLQRITANLAPADLRKAGPGFDLAIAAAVLAASGQLATAALADCWLAGELALDGAIRPLPGVLAMAERAEREQAERFVVAAGNAAEARLVEGLDVIAVGALSDLRAIAAGEIPAVAEPPVAGSPAPRLPDLADLKGQSGLRRGLEVAAAGGHAALVIGPPGAGKSLAARRLPSILPPLSRREAIEVTKIASVAGRPCADGSLAPRPFRAPHHTISAAGLVGGGSPPRPGEITLAHPTIKECLYAPRRVVPKGTAADRQPRRELRPPYGVAGGVPENSWQMPEPGRWRIEGEMGWTLATEPVTARNTATSPTASRSDAKATPSRAGLLLHAKGRLGGHRRR